MSHRTRLMLLVTTVAVVLFGVVAFHVVLSQGQFRLEKLQRQAEASQSQYERLRLQVAQLESPTRITNEAQNRLGMVHPEKVTAVAPKTADMPTGTYAGSIEFAGRRNGPPTTDDIGAWEQIKPHLSSSAK